MKAYRVDKELFDIGSRITKKPKYYADLDEKGRELEHVLEERRPVYYPKRIKSLFLFCHLTDAFEFWIKMRDSYVYEVEMVKVNSFFIFDMNNTEKMMQTQEYEAYAKKYWQKEKSERYIEECLCQIGKPIIKRIILDNTNTIRSGIFRVTHGYFPESVDQLRACKAFIDDNGLLEYIDKSKAKYLNEELFNSENKYY